MDKINLDLIELNLSENKTISGGGWLADFVADLVEAYKCSCSSDEAKRVARYKAIGL